MDYTAKLEAVTPKENDRFVHVRSCRLLVRRARAATLSTALNSCDGWPYGSLVTIALDYDLSPIMLFSTLSDHTRNLAIDNRASLLFEEASRLKNPQTGSRVSVLGRIEETSDEVHVKRFLAQHPEAAFYAGFGDFSFWRMTIFRAHFVGGFAKAVWFDSAEIQFDTNSKIAADIENSVLTHMNEDHAEAIDHYANNLLGRRGLGWQMTGVDSDGVDLRLGGRTARLEFAQPVNTLKEFREELVRLASKVSYSS
jgi:putative heme iron utilization protein